MVERLEGRCLLTGTSITPESDRLVPTADAAAVTVAPATEPLAAISNAQPELPRVYLDTTYTPGTGATINVPAGGNVQNAINAAQPGDTILLAAGATFTGNFTLPNKAGTGWVTIRTSAADSSLPAPGTRISPSHNGVMAKLVSNNNNPALATQHGAHHYRLIGIEFTVGAGVGTNYGIVTLGTSPQTAAQTPNNLILDRVYIHGTPTSQIQNGIRLNSTSTAIIDSYFDHNHATAFESHDIGGYNGPGPYKIVNNRFGAATIPVIFGGAVPSITGLIPSDIEFRQNYVSRPLSWRPGDPSYGGTAWYVKNLFELKNAQRVLIDGNIFEHNWPHTGSTPDGAPQHGFAMLFTVRAEGGSASWAVVQDVTVTNNIIRKSNVGISLYGVEGAGARRFAIENNLFDDIGLNWGNNDRSGLWMQVQTVGDLIVNHNTVINDGDIIFANGNTAGDLVFTNNIVNHNAARTTNRNYGINGVGTSVGTSTLNGKFVEYDVQKNAMANAAGYTSSYPAVNYFPTSFGTVGFTSLAARDYRLVTNSPFRNAATDGTDVGADFSVLGTATAGTISGIWDTTPPSAPSVVINDGHAQRSMITQLTLTFDEPVALSEGAILLRLQSGQNVPGTNMLVANSSADQRTYVVTFSGTAVTGGSLADGLYEVIVDADLVCDLAGNALAADSTTRFHRLFGDSDGDRDVDSSDSLRFRTALGYASGNARYMWWFDFDGDGDIDSSDSLRFRQRLGTIWV